VNLHATSGMPAVGFGQVTGAPAMLMFSTVSFVGSLSGAMTAVASVAPPAVRPLHQTRATPDVLLEIGRTLQRPTATAEEQVRIVEALFAAEQAKLKALVTTDIPALEREVEAAGAPYTAGRVVGR